MSARPPLSRRPGRRAGLATAILAALVLLWLPAPATAQAARTARVGVLSPFIGPDNEFFETVRHALRELGHVEGRNIAYVHRAGETFDQLQALAAEMVRARVDVIVTAGPQGVRAARNATSTVPIVMANVGDAVNQGFVTSLAKPGGNVTGLSSLNTELSAKRLELLKEALPGLTQVAVLREAAGDSATLAAVESRARALGLRLHVFQVRTADELPSAFAALTGVRLGALEVLPGSMLVSQARRVVELTAAARVPAIYPDDRFVRAGGLMSYGPNVVELYRRAAGYVDRILKGARAGDLPVEQPTTFVFAVHMQTARELGVAIPPALLLRADRVFP